MRAKKLLKILDKQGYYANKGNVWCYGKEFLKEYKNWHYDNVYVDNTKGRIILQKFLEEDVLTASDKFELELNDEEVCEIDYDLDDEEEIKAYCEETYIPISVYKENKGIEDLDERINYYTEKIIHFDVLYVWNEYIRETNIEEALEYINERGIY